LVTEWERHQSDNAAMVACAGSYWLRRGRRASLDLNPDPRRRLTD
jgi:tRNA A37 threonylcarbamoyltransferase TsaD